MNASIKRERDSSSSSNYNSDELSFDSEGPKQKRARRAADVMVDAAYDAVIDQVQRITKARFSRESIVAIARKVNYSLELILARVFERVEFEHVVQTQAGDSKLIDAHLWVKEFAEELRTFPRHAALVDLADKYLAGDDAQRPPVRAVQLPEADVNTSWASHLTEVPLDGQEGKNVLDVIRGKYPEEVTEHMFPVVRVMRVAATKHHAAYNANRAKIMARNGGRSNERLLFAGFAGSEESVFTMLKTAVPRTIHSSKHFLGGVGIYLMENALTLPYLACKYPNPNAPTPGNPLRMAILRTELGDGTSMRHVREHASSLGKTMAETSSAPDRVPGVPYDSASSSIHGNKAHPLHVVYNNEQTCYEYLVEFVPARWPYELPAHLKLQHDAPQAVVADAPPVAATIAKVLPPPPAPSTTLPASPALRASTATLQARTEAFQRRLAEQQALLSVARLKTTFEPPTSAQLLATPPSIAAPAAPVVPLTARELLGIPPLAAPAPAPVDPACEKALSDFDAKYQVLIRKALALNSLESYERKNLYQALAHQSMRTLTFIEKKDYLVRGILQKYKLME